MRRLLLALGLLLACCVGVPALSAPVGSTDDSGTVLKVATRHVPPLAIKRPEGRWTGITVELWKALRLLADGRADAVVYDEPILRYQVKEGFDDSLTVLPGHFERQDYGVAMPSGSRLREPFNRASPRYQHDPVWRATLNRYGGQE